MNKIVITRYFLKTEFFLRGMNFCLQVKDNNIFGNSNIGKSSNSDPFGE